MDGRHSRAARTRAPGFHHRLGAAAVAAVVIVGNGHAQPAAPASCAAHPGIAYLCGPKNIEDMEQVPGTPMLVAASYGLKAGGDSLALIDTHARTSAFLPIDVPQKPEAPYTACPGPLDLARFSPHGIALGQGGRTLYVVNHGGRESIEMFALDLGPKPRARWIGCAVLPEGASGNAVAPTSNGGFVATKFFDTREGPFRPQFVARKRTSLVYRWSPGKGFSVIPGGEGIGDNGVLVSPDGQWLYVTSWVEKAILRLPMSGSAPVVRTPVDFMPDNLRWGPDGAILVAGQATDIDLLVACKHTRCSQDWAVARLDPKTMKVAYLYWEKGTAEFAGATTAVQVDDKLWLGTFYGDRLAIADLPREPLGP